MENAVVPYQPSEYQALSTSLMSIESQLERIAAENINSVMQAGFTEAERRAAIKIEELRLVKGLDLAAIFLRDKLLTEIEQQGLWADHPNGFANLAEMAIEVGISRTQLAYERTLCHTIFPYFQDHMDIQPAQIFERLGRSNMQELVPVLTVLITGEPSERTTTNQSAERLLDDTAASLQSAAATNGTPAPTEDQVRDATIEALVEAGSVMSNRDLRRHVRPAPTAGFTPTIMRVNGHRYFMAKLDPDQLDALTRKLGTFLEDPIVFDLPQDERARRIEAARIPLIREINTILD